MLEEYEHRNGPLRPDWSKQFRLPMEGTQNGSGEQDACPSMPDPSIDALMKSLKEMVVPPSRTVVGRSRDLLDCIARAAVDFIFVVDLEGKLAYVNPAAAQFLDTTQWQLFGQPLSALELLPEPDEAENILAHVVAQEAVVTYERRVTVRSETRHLRGTLSPIWDSNGAIDGVLGIVKDLSDLASTIEELRSGSMIDALTGVYNRRGFVSFASQQLSLAQRNGTGVSLLLADMDELKRINDSFGHLEGDVALIALASILRVNSRRADVIARIGGDEFAILTPGVFGGGSRFLIERLRQAILIEDREGGRPYRFSASIGATEREPGEPVTLDALLAEADTAMYTAKKGRAR